MEGTTPTFTAVVTARSNHSDVFDVVSDVLEIVRDIITVSVCLVDS